MWIFNVNKILLISSILVISSFLTVQHVLSYPPCKLCILQRYPWYALFVINVLHFLTNTQPNTHLQHYIRKYQFLFSLSYFVLLLISATLALYHVGVEEGIIVYSQCVSSIGVVNDISDFDKALRANNVVCSEVPFRVLGFSLAGINFIFSTLLLLLLSATQITALLRKK